MPKKVHKNNPVLYFDLACDTIHFVGNIFVDIAFCIISLSCNMIMQIAICEYLDDDADGECEYLRR